MLHIKSKGTEHRAPKMQISVLTYTLDPWGVVKRSKKDFFSESGNVHRNRIFD